MQLVKIFQGHSDELSKRSAFTLPVMRIAKILSDLGIASRREAKAYIKAGRVVVNGTPVNAYDMKCDTDHDEIRFDGNPIRYERYVYLMLNKPAGYICATEDHNERTVLDLLETELSRLKLFPVGRLDKDTEGILLLTNDGEFGHRITSPKHDIVKTYYLETVCPIEGKAEKLVRDGLELSDGTKCLPGELEILSADSAFLRISEGKYHQVKRMMASLGSPVKYLKRTSIGGLCLDNDLQPGKYRQLTKNERLSVFEKPVIINKDDK